VPLSVKILADSRHPDGSRLTTFELVYPRVPVHEHLLTHRVFSRNSASHRALPVHEVLKAVASDLVVPYRWPANGKGMVPSGLLESGFALQEVNDAWMDAAASALRASERLAAAGVHKEVANRPLIPYMHISTVLSSTTFSNFLALRMAEDVEEETRQLAQGVVEELEDSSPCALSVGEWHLPYVTVKEVEAEGGELGEHLAYVSAARCARVSTLRQNEQRPLDVEHDWTQRNLIMRKHWSPLEHPAQCISPDRLLYNVPSNYAPGWFQLRKHFGNEHDASLKE
jgi:hypothetical protein